MELSCKRDAHFDKITFFVPGTFFDAKWSPKGLQNGAKKAFKIYEKSDAFFDRKMHGFLVKNGALGEPKGTPKSRKNHDVFSSPSQDPSRGVKWSQNDLKMEPKWGQMGSKWHQNGAKIGWKINETLSENNYVFWEFLPGFQTFFLMIYPSFLEFM